METIRLFEAGEIVVADFPGITGVKRRPAVVLSSGVFHDTHHDIILGLLTSQTRPMVGPTDYPLVDWREAGLKLPSVFRAFIFTVQATAIHARIGHLSERDWMTVKARIRIALAVWSS